MDMIFNNYDMGGYKFMGHISDTDLYNLFDEGELDELFGGCNYERLAETILKHGDNMDVYNDLNSQSCDDVLVEGNYVIGEFQNVMGGTDWVLFEVK